MEVKFYQFLHVSFYHGMISLLQKIIDQKYRVLILVHGNDLQHYDDKLWSSTSISFLPHATERDDLLDMQPIILATEIADYSDMDILVNLTNLSLQDMKQCFQFIIELFDGNNIQHLQIARRKWMEYKQSDMLLTYWKQDSMGKWIKN